ncbi:MAG: hypothetical protein AAF493_12940 [Pseudomonadota bacterium]
MKRTRNVFGAWRRGINVVQVTVAIIAICTTGSALAAKGGFRQQVSVLNKATIIKTGITQFNKNPNIVLSAGYTGAAGYDDYYISLDQRPSDGCRVYVGRERVPATTFANADSILLDPFDIMDAAGVPEWINKEVSIPMQVECLSEDGDAVVEKGHVTGTLFPIQAPLPD